MQWQEKDNCLFKEFNFVSKEQSLGWANECIEIGKKMNHDPHEVLNNGLEVVVWLTTHDQNKVTEKDWNLAKALDGAFYTSGNGLKTHLLGSAEAHNVWIHLFERQHLNLQHKAHPWFWDGLKILELEKNNIPELEQINQNLKNFKSEPTPVQYEGDEKWFEFLAKRKIMRTKYIRVLEDVDYTPLPDIFHDVFGHLPLLTNTEVASLAEKFGHTFLKAENDLQRFMVERLWWNSFEFGLMEVNGEKLIIRAGLFSSFGECNFAFGPQAKLVEFKQELLSTLDRSPHSFHKSFMVFKSFEQISETLDWILKQ